MIRPCGRVTREPIPFGALSCVLAVLLFSCAPERPYHFVRIQVLAAGPLAEAEVFLWWVDVDGHPLTKEGQRSPYSELSARTALAQGRTDQRGVVELPTGPAYGLIVLGTRGGWTRDPWVEADSASDAGPPCDACDAAPGNAPGEPSPLALPVDVELRSVLHDFIPGPEHRDVVVSPLTTLAAAMGDNYGPVGNGKAPPYPDRIRNAFAALGAHFGGIDLTRGPVPVGADQPIPGLGATAKHVLALQGLAGLAHRIAEASGIAGRSFHTMDLLEGLLLDVADSSAFLDGVSFDGAVVVGSCPMPDGCARYGNNCRSLCWLDGTTLRSRLANTLARDFVPAPFNHTTLALADLYPYLEHLASNDDAALFGPVDSTKPGDDIDSAPPAIEVAGMVYDERHDVVTFDENAVPIHTSGEDALIELDREAPCPVVGKYVHRLDDPGANPLRWHVVVRDRSGWQASGSPDVSLEYRVKALQLGEAEGPAAGNPATGVSGDFAGGFAGDSSGDSSGDSPARPDDGSCSNEPGKYLLTDWLPAEPIGSVDDDGVLFEVTLLREHLPALAENLTGKLEIAFRGRDGDGRESVSCRCWDHLLLPVPLEIGELTVPVGPGSLNVRSLHPGNNMAPLINGVPLAEGPVLASFLIRNGTDEPGYLRFSIEQPLVHYTKCWRRSNAEFGTPFMPAPDCLERGECLLDVPPDRQTIVAVDEGILEHLITGLRVQDLSTQASTTVDVCAGCEIREHTIAPRAVAAGPRTYRVDVLLSDLGALAPRTPIEPVEPVVETALVPPHLTVLTGAVAGDFLQICTVQEVDGCRQANLYQSYRLLSAAELVFDTPLWLRAGAAPLADAAEATHSILLELESFAWSTLEHNLPVFLFPSPPPPPLCPVDSAP